jgi:hypothetical protein
MHNLFMPPTSPSTLPFIRQKSRLASQAAFSFVRWRHLPNSRRPFIILRIRTS